MFGFNHSNSVFKTEFFKEGNHTLMSAKFCSISFDVPAVSPWNFLSQRNHESFSVADNKLLDKLIDSSILNYFRRKNYLLFFLFFIEKAVMSSLESSFQQHKLLLIASFIIRKSIDASMGNSNILGYGM